MQQIQKPSTQIWRIVAVINFPMEFILKSSSFVPGAKTKATSRIPNEATLEIGGISVMLKPWPGQPIPAFSSRR
jgi:hypothetical protein